MAKYEFIKLQEDRYLIKNSNNIVVDKKRMLQLQETDLVLEDISSCECQKENTKKRKKIKEEIKKIEAVESNETEPIKETK